MTARTPPAEVCTGDDGHRTLVWRRHYPDPVDDVWAAITESERLARWFGTWTGDPATGVVSLTMTGEVDAGGTVSEPIPVRIRTCDPPRRIVVDLGGDGWHLDLTVEPDGDGAVLVFAQRTTAETVPGEIDGGWRWYLDRLGAALSGDPMPDWSAYV